MSGAVFADQLIAQPLTDYISVIPQSAHKFSAMSEAMLRVARLFRALKQCIADLKTYYCDLQGMKSLLSFLLEHFQTVTQMHSSAARGALPSSHHRVTSARASVPTPIAMHNRLN